MVKSTTMLQEIFSALTSKTSNDQNLCQALWKELTFNYGLPSRHYHNLTHLKNLIQELEPCKMLIQDYDVVLYSVFYHDIVYDVLNKDNEERSATIAVEALNLLGIDEYRVKRCAQQILATKSHTLHSDNDTNLFTDADLSILGKDEKTYNRYSEQVRQEYAAYKDEAYYPGRVKVLQHFLAMTRIYKTDFFYNLYEEPARKNMMRELDNITNQC
jgi:predicted metal-dependent HD superfamily phosphohydrolase